MLREVEADALWLYCKFKVSLGYNEILSQKNKGGIEIIITKHTEASRGGIRCLIFFCCPLPWVVKRVLYQLLLGNGLHSELRNQAPYVGGTDRESQVRAHQAGGRRQLLFLHPNGCTHVRPPGPPLLF